MIPLVLGILLMSLTVMFHVAGTVIWAHFVITARRSGKWPPEVTWQSDARRIMRAFFLTTVVILGLHVTEVLMWAAAYYCLPSETKLGEFSHCVYFSMVTYTTLGYGDIVVQDSQWRLLTGIQAMGGMLAFGWSSALLFAAVQQVVQVNASSLRS